MLIKQIKQKIAMFVTIAILKMLVLNMKIIFVIDVMI